MTRKNAVIVLAGVFAAGAATGMTLGWKLWRPIPKQIIEKKAQEVRQQDGSVIIKRDPEAKPEHRNEVPKGAEVERETKVTVSLGQSQGETIGTLGTPPEARDLSAVATGKVRIYLTLVRMPDGTRRVIASSPDGTIDSSSIDIPMAPVTKLEPKTLNWSAGGVFGKDQDGGKSVGVFVDRRIGWAVAGAELARVTSKQLQGWDVRLRFGISF